MKANPPPIRLFEFRNSAKEYSWGKALRRNRSHSGVVSCKQTISAPDSRIIFAAASGDGSPQFTLYVRMRKCSPIGVSAIRVARQPEEIAISAAKARYRFMYGILLRVHPEQKKFLPALAIRLSDCR